MSVNQCKQEWEFQILGKTEIVVQLEDETVILKDASKLCSRSAAGIQAFKGPQFHNLKILLC